MPSFQYFNTKIYSFERQKKEQTIKQRINFEVKIFFL